MAKKDSKGSKSNAKKASKKNSGSKKQDRETSKQLEEVAALTAEIKALRKENDKFSKRLDKLEKNDKLEKRVRTLEKDDALSRRLKTLERDYSKSAKDVESLANELRETKTAATSVRRKKNSKATSGNGGPKRPGEESEPIITKAAERKAVDLGVDLSKVKGSGAEGRITVADVRKKADGAAKSGSSRSGKSSGRKAAKK